MWLARNLSNPQSKEGILKQTRSPYTTDVEIERLKITGVKKFLKMFFVHVTKETSMLLDISPSRSPRAKWHKHDHHRRHLNLESGLNSSYPEDPDETSQSWFGPRGK